MKRSINTPTVAVFLATALLVVAGCSSRTVVTRVDTEEQIDLSGRWNDTDSRLVSEEMIRDCLNHPWLSEHMTAKAKKPVVIVGAIRNKSQEHIPVGTFVGDIERAYVNSGKVQVVASAVERDDLRSEKRDQRINATEETLKAMGREVGADYMLIGEINQIIDSEKGEKVSYYQADLTLVDIETNVKAWLGQKKIKKYIGRSEYKP
ncbi:MAG TPA: penicillin-binding protein activator LpoB [bacterium]|nr:penicillin-binding protein activator LpoB [bacterium]